MGARGLLNGNTGRGILHSVLYVEEEQLLKLGATYLDDRRCQFGVWAPDCQQVEVQLLTDPPRQIALEKRDYGYWQGELEGISPGDRYWFCLDGKEVRPDPASQWQPDGVHQASAVVDHAAYRWQDGDWQGIALADYIIYELHGGTFTPAGTFAGIIDRLDYLKTLGITALELMPVAQFPGDRNWGYDGVYPFAVQQSYGGVDGLKALVDACHQAGIAVVLDVVYNHFGPEGNYSSQFGPYMTDQYQTPWGKAINYDQAHSDGVRHFFISNALYWFEQFHMDALRLDALHAVYDFGAKHFLAELAEKTQELSARLHRPLYLIGESDLNDVRLIDPLEKGGYGLDAQWCDDFHHALHTRLTGETQGYYQDFVDRQSLVMAYRQRFVYDWKYSAFRQRHHGSDARDCPPQQFVVCSQNHDQVGNRMLGDRLSQLVPFEALKLAASAVLLSPYVPLLFMGEEYGETQPFLYFVSHGDRQLNEAVRQGRKTEFADFHCQGEPPDPASETTFEQSQLNWALLNTDSHQALFRYYQRLIYLRKHLTNAASESQTHPLTVHESQGVIQLIGQGKQGSWVVLLNFESSAISLTSVALEPTAPRPGQYAWEKQLDSASVEWGGSGMMAPSTIKMGDSVTLAPFNALLYQASA
ncbi:MAG: malto-oligosyltrehalose trehalohydrolase [Synechocystis sp.]|nr:malto-oligosyltrehalose trehalohydrolase [Synechocystis sp.]